MKAVSAILIGGFALRLALFRLFPGMPASLDGRVECSTPVSSFKRLQEGLYQYGHGAEPYHGGVFHQSPLLLAFLSVVDGSVGSISFDLVYSLADVVIAYSLARSASKLKNQSHSKLIVPAIYLFNPFTLLSTFSRSTNIFSNLTISLALGAATNGNPIQAMNALAMGACLSLYPAYLAPAVVFLSKQFKPSVSAVKLGAVFFISIAFYIGLSFMVTQSWEFVDSVYGTIIFLYDLTPTIGIWWYFFTEMFEFFRPFFVGVFQIYLAVYSLPVALRFQNYPSFAVATVWGLTTMFRSYPEVGDIGFYFTLLTLYKPMFGILKYPLITTLVIMYASVLGPTFYHLWIFAGSGNSNFFYAITLVYSLGMTLIIADSVWATIRYEYDGGKNPNVSQI